MEELYGYFERLHVPPLGSSRIAAYRKVFRKLVDFASGGPRLLQHDAEMLFHAGVEFAQLRKILSAANVSNHPIWKDRIRVLAGDLAIPEAGAKHSPVRDFQFETYLGAVFTLANCDVAFVEPPDLLITLPQVGTVGCAAKRPRSLRKVEANCRDAVRQLKKAGIPGFIAFDLSVLLGLKRCVNTSDSLGGAYWAKSMSDKFLMAHYRLFNHLCKNSEVFAIVTYLHMPVLVMPTLEITSAFRIGIFPLVNPDDQRMDWIWALEHRFELGNFGSRDA